MTIPTSPQSPPSPATGATEQSGTPAAPSPGQPERVQADNLLSQPESDDDQGYGPVGEEISLDQQSDQARNVGQAPADASADEALAETLRPDDTRGSTGSTGPAG